VGRDAVIDTQGHTGVIAEEPGTGLSRRSGSWLVVVFVAILTSAVMSLIHVPYAILTPGPVTNTLGNGAGGKPLITIQGKATFPTTGVLDFTTVEVFGGPKNPTNAWDWIFGHLDRTSTVVPEEVLFPPGVTSKQVDQVNAAEMAGSQQEAIVVALRGLGQKVPEVITITDLTKDSPARGVLRKGDVVVSIDGKAVTTSDALRAVISAHKPGESAVFTVRRNGTDHVLPVKTAASQGRTVAGVFLRTTFDFPTKVTIDAGDVGGPSAGMMFSLAIYDKLTPGALTGGAKIAGTGTINSAGAVGPIGGIRQKLTGAQRGGDAWFLAPAANCDEVVGHIPDGLQVFKVATFAQARDAVKAIATKRTASLPQCI